jgi:hypothetical protein
MLHIVAGKTIIGKEGDSDGARGEAKADLSGSLTRQVTATMFDLRRYIRANSFVIVLFFHGTMLCRWLS